MMYFVTRAIDDAVLGRDGNWHKMFADVGEVKFFKRISNAQKYGIGNIKESMYRPELGNMHSIGTVHAVREGETPVPVLNASHEGGWSVVSVNAVKK